ncbi:hypothetical protein HDV05_002673 [Chytridiales sp. JEL 0842]|nr:hypothetical protein HDV05_002673 [Chytridiales sp. JEL 0842]
MREFAYVQGTTWNRLAFSRVIQDVLDEKSGIEPLKAKDIHQLLELMCPDIPLELVERCAEITSFTMGLDVPMIVKTANRQCYSVQVPVEEFAQNFKRHFLLMEYVDQVEKSLREAFSMLHKTNMADGKESGSSEPRYTSEDMAFLQENFSKTLEKDTAKLR